MEIEPGDPADDVAFGNEDRRLDPGALVQSFKCRGRYQDRVESEALTCDEPLDDQPAFGDEQPGGLQPPGVGHVAVSRDTRVVRIGDLDDHARRRPTTRGRRTGGCGGCR